MRHRHVPLLAVVILSAGPPGRLSAQDRPTGPLAVELAPLMQTRTWARATWGALVVSLTTGDTLFSWRADRRFIPASNAKLFTTAAALHYLGRDYRFLTVLFADGPVRGGTLLGDLVLYGTGDPTFALDTASLAPFADSVVRAGIRMVRGDLVGDASFLGAELAGPGWAPDNVTSSWSAPPSALGASENRIRILVEPGPRPGAPATWTVDPPNDYYAVHSVVLTGRPRTRTRIAIRRGRSRGVVELSGAIPVGNRGWSGSVLVEEPAVFAAGLLRGMLRARGVTVTGATRSVSDGADERARTMLARSAGGGGAFEGAIAVRRSAPLGRLIAMINHRSHNLSAELALRTIGRMTGHAGTYASGALAVQRFLTADVGIPAGAVQVSDGSGLSLLDETTPRALIQLLAFMRRAPEGVAFYQSLPVVGAGIRERMVDTPAQGRLRAKTGTLREVSALAGYVTTEGGEELAFAIVVNGAPSIRRARLVQDSIGARLSALTRSVPAGTPSRTTAGAAPPPGCCR